MDALHLHLISDAASGGLSLSIEDAVFCVRFLIITGGYDDLQHGHVCFRSSGGDIDGGAHNSSQQWLEKHMPANLFSYHLVASSHELFIFLRILAGQECSTCESGHLGGGHQEMLGGVRVTPPANHTLNVGSYTDSTAWERRFFDSSIHHLQYMRNIIK